MKLHLLAGIFFALTGAVACSSSHEPLVPAPVTRHPPGDPADEPRKPVRETSDAEKEQGKEQGKEPNRAATPPVRREARTLDRDAAKRLTLLWFLLRSPLGG